MPKLNVRTSSTCSQTTNVPTPSAATVPRQRHRDVCVAQVVLIHQRAQRDAHRVRLDDESEESVVRIAADELYSLAIDRGVKGARLTHSHARQYDYCLQSLWLWKEIQRNMFRLWCLADEE